jgi:hypothetical protein
MRARVCAIVYLLEVHFHIFPTVIFAPSAAGRGRARGFNEQTIKRNTLFINAARCKRYGARRRS